MDDSISKKPKFYAEIEAKTKEIGFSMPSDLYIGALLKTLISSKPESNSLELLEIARCFFGKDERVNIVCADGSEWIKNYVGEKFDLVFADAWPGKYSEIDLVLDLLNVGGFYIIDDMQVQEN